LGATRHNRTSEARRGVLTPSPVWARFGPVAAYDARPEPRYFGLTLPCVRSFVARFRLLLSFFLSAPKTVSLTWMRPFTFLARPLGSRSFLARPLGSRSFLAFFGFVMSPPWLPNTVTVEGRPAAVCEIRHMRTAKDG